MQRYQKYTLFVLMLLGACCAQSIWALGTPHPTAAPLKWGGYLYPTFENQTAFGMLMTPTKTYGRFRLYTGVGIAGRVDYPQSGEPERGGTTLAVRSLIHAGIGWESARRKNRPLKWNLLFGYHPDYLATGDLPFFAMTQIGIGRHIALGGGVITDMKRTAIALQTKVGNVQMMANLPLEAFFRQSISDSIHLHLVADAPIVGPLALRTALYNLQSFWTPQTLGLKLLLVWEN